MATANPHTVTKEVIAYEKSGQPVYLVYDTWTPRPHFIIVQYQSKQDANDGELQASYEIIGSFLHANSKFDNEAILSFHRGKWYQQHTSKWHAHLCVPEQPYLEEAKIKITDIPNNKEWRGAKTVEQGIKNLHTKKTKDYDKYKNECVQKNFPAHTSVEKCRLSTFDSNSQDFQLVWTYPAPRIGIVARSPTTTTIGSLYKFMSKVRSDAEEALRKCDSSFAKFGCHLCLYVRGQSDTTFVTCRQGQVLSENGQLSENPNIVGYIQMDESQYVEWLPPRSRDVWLNEFRRAEHFVRT